MSLSMLLILQFTETIIASQTHLARKDIKTRLQQGLGWLWSPTCLSPSGDKHVRILCSIPFMFQRQIPVKYVSISLYL